MNDRKRLRVLVVGGAGGVGEGIVRALLRYRYRLDRLFVSSRDAARLARLHASLNEDELVVPIVGSVEASTSAHRLRDAVLAVGPLDVVIASLGGWWEGPPLTQIDDDTWRATLDTMLTTHFVCTRTFVPVLEESQGKYLLIGGGAALTPVPGSSLVSIAAAAQVMLTRALVTERRDQPFPLIAELLVDGPVKTSARHHGPIRAGEITAFEVGKAVAKWALHHFEWVDASFDWPMPLLSHDGPIAIMHPRPDDFEKRNASDHTIDELARARLANYANLGEHGVDAAFEIRRLQEFAPGDAWAVVLRMLELDPCGEHLPVIAAGEVEDLLSENGPAIIERIEADAKADPRVASVLAGVWLSRMDPEIWNRIRAICDRRGWDGETEPADHWWIAARPMKNPA